jgi:hypothetical protein
MEAPANKNNLNNIAFYFLMGILGFSVVFTVGYLLYSAIFG